MVHPHQGCPQRRSDLMGEIPRRVLHAFCMRLMPEMEPGLLSPAFDMISTFPSSILGPQENEDIQFLLVPHAFMDILLPVLSVFTPVENGIDIMDSATIRRFGNSLAVRTGLGTGLGPSFSARFISTAGPGNPECPKRQIFRMIIKCSERRYLSEPFQAIIILCFCDDHEYSETL